MDHLTWSSCGRYISQITYSAHVQCSHSDDITTCDEVTCATWDTSGGTLSTILLIDECEIGSMMRPTNMTWLVFTEFRNDYYRYGHVQKVYVHRVMKKFNTTDFTYIVRVDTSTLTNTCPSYEYRLCGFNVTSADDIVFMKLCDAGYLGALIISSSRRIMWCQRHFVM